MPPTPETGESLSLLGSLYHYHPLISALRVGGREFQRQRGLNKMRILCKLGTEGRTGTRERLQPLALLGWGRPPHENLGNTVGRAASLLPISQLLPSSLTSRQTGSPEGPLRLQWETPPRNKEPSGGLGFLECTELSEQIGAT